MCERNCPRAPWNFFKEEITSYPLHLPVFIKLVFFFSQHMHFIEFIMDRYVSVAFACVWGKWSGLGFGAAIDSGRRSKPRRLQSLLSTVRCCKMAIF